MAGQKHVAEERNSADASATAEVFPILRYFAQRRVLLP
jgi:hypothetical protein